MRKLLILLTLLPLFGWSQLYYTQPTSGTSAAPYVYDGGWSPPAIWADSLGAIDITDGRALAASTIKILVDTRAGNRTFAFTVTATNGYKVKWGKGESWTGTINSDVLAERTYYDTTKCQKYCVIEITKAGAGAITAFTISRSVTFVATQTQYPSYLWIAANYVGSSPIMYSSALRSNQLESVYLMSVTSISNISFGYCPSLKSLTIPSSTTSIGGSILYNCTALRMLTIPISVTSITGNSCFNNCYSLTYLTILGAITSTSQNLFQNCYSLKSLTIPNSVTSIGGNAFAGCVSLKYLKYTGTITTAEDYYTDLLYQCEQIDTLNFKGVKTTRFSFYGENGKLNKLGASGNLANDSIPIRLDWANSTFAHATAPQLNLSYNSMDTTQIQKIFKCLPTVGAAGSNTKTVTVVGCTGAATLSTYATGIATAKGWQVLK